MISSTKTLRPNTVASILIVLAAALLLLRLPMISAPVLWHDEAFSLYHARLPLAHLWSEGWRLESSPPLYYSTLWAWIRLISDSETSGRALSWLLTALTGYFLYRATRTLAGPARGPLAGAIAVVFWLLPPLGLEYSIEIRPYALQLFWIALAFAAFANAVSAHRTSPLTTQSSVFKALALIVLPAVAAFYTHTTSLAFVSGIAAAGLYFGWATKAKRTYFYVWLGACAVFALLCLPQFMMATGVLASNRSGLAWIPSSLDPKVLSYLIRQWVMGSLPWSFASSAAPTGLVLAFFAFCAWQLRARADVIALCLVAALTGAVFLWLAALIQPVMLTRTALWLWLPLAMLTGCAAANWNWHSVMPKLVATALVILLLGTSYMYASTRSIQRPWHDSIDQLAAKAKPGERVLVIDPEIACVLDHYASSALSTLPRGRLELGSHQRFRSGQRLNIRCNRLPEISEAQVANTPGRSDWVMTDGEAQRADLAGLVRRSGGKLQITDIIIGAGQARASRIVRSEQP